MIVANHLTDERSCDGTIAPTLIGQTGHIDSIAADKGYDQVGVYEAAQVHLKRGEEMKLHPRANEVVTASGEVACGNEINTSSRSMKTVC